MTMIEMTISSSRIVKAGPSRNFEFRIGKPGRSFARVTANFEILAHVCCCRPLMMLINGMNKAMTIVPTTTARKTIMIGSSMEVSAATELSTSSS